MSTDRNKRERTVQPCNFRSAGRLSNESARALKTLHESLARNLMNTLDVYLGTSLEIKLQSLEQMAMEDYRAALATAGYILPCTLAPAAHTLLLEMDAGLLFICYQRDPRQGFIKLFERMSKFDMLNQFVTHVGGGLFAAPPGVAPGRYLGEELLGA